METPISIVVLEEFVKVDGSGGRPPDGIPESGARVLMPCTPPVVGPGEGVMSRGICHRTLVLYWYKSYKMSWGISQDKPPDKPKVVSFGSRPLA